MIDAHTALRACEALVGLAMALQTGELLWARDGLRDGGALGWPAVRAAYGGAPARLQGALDGLLAYRPFLALLGLQLATACALAVGVFPVAAAPLLVLTSLLVSARFRGPYNGGSDVMTMVVLLGICVAHLLGAQVGLGYVAAQLVLSYFVAGVVKLRRAAWRDGSALRRLVTAGSYPVPTRAVRAIDGPARLRLASWAVIVFECAFPLALFDRRACLALLAAGALFHVANTYLLGLNRFFWAWLAAYPALYYWAALRG